MSAASAGRVDALVLSDATDMGGGDRAADVATLGRGAPNEMLAIASRRRRLSRGEPRSTPDSILDPLRACSRRSAPVRAGPRRLGTCRTIGAGYVPWRIGGAAERAARRPGRFLAPRVRRGAQTLLTRLMGQPRSVNWHLVSSVMRGRGDVAPSKAI